MAPARTPNTPLFIKQASEPGVAVLSQDMARAPRGAMVRSRRLSRHKSR